MDEPLITDEIIDRLVDGELSGDERRDVLRSLDGERDGWRRCALAFVEAQSFRRSLRTLIEPQPLAVADQAVRAAAPPVRDLRFTTPWWAAAAAIAVAFGLGRGWQTEPAVPNGESPQVASLVPLGGKPIDPADAVTLVVRGIDGKPQRIHVPLVEGDELGRQFAVVPQWQAAPQMQSELEQRGLNLATRRRYAPMFFEQKDRLAPLVVPVDDVYVTPVKREVL